MPLPSSPWRIWTALATCWARRGPAGDPVPRGLHRQAFRAVGGFSTRHSINQFVTVLPYSDLAEAESILASSARSFTRKEFAPYGRWPSGSRPRRSVWSSPSLPARPGPAIVELDSIIEFAKFRQKEIARLECVVGGKENETVCHGDSDRYLRPRRVILCGYMTVKLGKVSLFGDTSYPSLPGSPPCLASGPGAA